MSDVSGEICSHEFCALQYVLQAITNVVIIWVLSHILASMVIAGFAEYMQWHTSEEAAGKQQQSLTSIAIAKGVLGWDSQKQLADRDECPPTHSSSSRLSTRLSTNLPVTVSIFGSRPKAYQQPQKFFCCPLLLQPRKDCRPVIRVHEVGRPFRAEFVVVQRGLEQIIQLWCCCLHEPEGEHKEGCMHAADHTGFA